MSRTQSVVQPPNSPVRGLDGKGSPWDVSRPDRFGFTGRYPFMLVTFQGAGREGFLQGTRMMVDVVIRDEPDGSVTYRSVGVICRRGVSRSYTNRGMNQ